MNNVIIHCKTQEQAKKVLEKIEKDHPNVKWTNGGEKPTEWIPSYNSKGTINIKVQDDILINGNSEDNGVSVIQFLSRRKAKEKKVNFILQYNFVEDEDPIKEFTTMKEVKDRIKELTSDDADQELDIDSVKIYEVVNVKTIEVKKQVIVK